VHTNDRPGADKRYAQDDLKICRELGWSPLYKFDEVIGSTVKWYLDQKDWWQEIKGKQIFIEHYNRQEQANYY
jgi:dTDP-glucose 4,6-dehydratase